ncbi:MAG: LysR family transcriptional regulator [Bdellovibrionales bacterium]|nr:LysR family transcriptional regulator [Bdellovibrionales bacterium]
MNVNLLHLYYFYHVAKNESVTAASLLLKIQQPALSIMIKKFEGAIGFPVFEKSGRKIKLTDKGRELYVYAEEVFSKVEKLEEFIGQKSNEVSGRLKIATNDLIAHYVLLPLIAKWLTDYPLVDLSIVYLSAQEACAYMIKGEVDFGLFFHGPEEISGVEFEKIKKLPFVCAGVKKDHNIFIGSRDIEYSLTAKLPTFDKLKKISPNLKIKMNSNGLMLHKELALQGVGAVVLPTFSIKEELKTKRLVNLLPHEKLEFSMKLYQRKNKVLSQTQELFLEDVIGSLSQF